MGSAWRYVLVIVAAIAFVAATDDWSGAVTTGIIATAAAPWFYRAEQRRGGSQ